MNKADNTSDRGSLSIEARRVAVTGIGAVSPNGVGRERFWEGLLGGRSGVKRIRGFDASRLKTRIAAQIQDFDGREALPEEDPMNVWRAVPLALQAAREALDDSGLRPAALEERDQRRIGVVIGSCGAGSDYLPRDGALDAPLLIGGPLTGPHPRATIGALSSEVSNRFNLLGLSHVISTGWTSSTDAIGYAFHWVRMGEIDFCLTGGVEAPITPSVMKGFEKAGVMTQEWNEMPEAASRPFDRNRSGFVLGEGSWMFVLEPLDQARRRGARIWGEVVSYASTCDGSDRTGFGAGMESARAMTEALEKARIDIKDVDYVQLHGASSPREDREETQSVKRAFKGRANEIPMSSVKGAIGHPQGACGAAGAAATLLAIARSIIPPTMNLDTPDPECDLDYVPTRPIKRPIRVAVCNTLGLNSKNSALVFSVPAFRAA